VTLTDADLDALESYYRFADARVLALIADYRKLRRVVRALKRTDARATDELNAALAALEPEK
jgi:hypothetical protein